MLISEVNNDDNTTPLRRKNAAADSKHLLEENPLANSSMLHTRWPTATTSPRAAEKSADLERQGERVEDAV